jgi:hypothetical protein
VPSEAAAHDSWHRARVDFVGADRCIFTSNNFVMPSSLMRVSSKRAGQPWPHHRPWLAKMPAAGRRASLRVPGATGSLDYKSSGVDIDAGNELVRRIKKLNPEIGGFSGMYPFGVNLPQYQGA